VQEDAKDDMESKVESDMRECELRRDDAHDRV